MTPLWDKRVDRVYDALADSPDGLTLGEIAKKSNITVPQVRKCLHNMRLVLGDNDTLFVIADPDGLRQPWRYRLVDGGAVVDDEQSGWTPNRIGDAQTRVRMLAMAMGVAKRATKPGTVLGRKAREMERVLRHLVEDLEAIDAEV